MEPLIRALNDPKNQGSPAQIHEIQKQLQALQRETAAWQTSLDFLQNPDAIIRFYGALTLTIKINADWKTDRVGKDKDARNSLLEALVTNYVRLALLEDENFVLQKLASTLATLYQRLASEWPSPVRHLLASLIQRQHVSPDQLPPMSDIINATSQVSPKQMVSVLRFSMTLAEDISSRVPGSTTQQQLSTGTGDNLELLSYILGRYCARLEDPSVSVEFARGDYLMLAQLAFEVLPQWTSLLRLSEAHTSKDVAQAANKTAVQCTTMALKTLGESAVAGAALHALVMIQTLSPRLLSKADQDFPRSLATSAVAQQWVASLVRGDTAHEALIFVDLLEAIMLQVDTTSTDYIHSGRYVEVMDLLVILLKCEGAAGVEDEVCQRILETLSTVVEGHTDWDPEPESERFLEQFVGQVCEACLEKTKLPAEEMTFATRTWDKDDRQKFQDFRYDVQDFLQSGFGVVGRPLLEAIARRALSAADWRDFEGSLYCLIAFADTLIDGQEIYDPLISSVLDGPHFREVVHSENVPDVARKTCIKFISEMTVYFKAHPNLMQILNFLFSSLHLPASAAIASRAIYTLCDSQRSTLTNALPGFLGSLDTISDLRGMERHRIFGAVAAVVQSIGDDDGKVQPLLSILDILVKDVQQSDTVLPQDEFFMEQNTDQVQTLAAIGRGLRASSGHSIDLEDKTQNDAKFWLTGSGAIVQQRTIQVYQRILDRVGSHASSDFVEACCNFVRSGFTEVHPSPFKFSSEASVDLLSRHINILSPNIDVVMVSAASLLSAASRNEYEPQFPRLLQPILAGMQELLNSPKRDEEIRNSTYPSASLDFMATLIPRWGPGLLSLAEAQEALAICFELALIVIAEPDTLPRRAAAHFFGVFIELSRPGKLAPDSRSYQNIVALSERYQPQVLALILRLVGGECARSELDVLAEQIRRYVHSQPMVFKNIGREAMKEESRVMSEKALQATTREERDRFISQVDALRGARKTVEVVKDFWMSCRGVDWLA